MIVVADYGVGNLQSVKALNWFALDAKRPVFGICVGGQLLGHESEEAQGVPGLGWLNMRCRRFPDRSGFRVPNMSWNTVVPRDNPPIFKYLDEDSRFYFVHSYYMECAEPDLSVATADYGFPYTCAVRKHNIFGVQFHPEKSLRHGMGVLKAFAEMSTAGGADRPAPARGAA
jgi:glutamine amidotransferase